ncbi:MAG: hypothetical protein COZ27_01805 [Candidatus Moranbacteria bacterium CG_4_10_14_3_um_filter_41_65]|nr:MAG: hypothetical protein COX32_02695 [Candidatus Moranbacteria bacterium CG23_combo_of_CG06-09_8_20_14_all_41_28]PIV86487.1 MAG: hypothetical protein COW50_01120 [Candidatus Moranbacteria bacterium CG17_big_fil_post_rev_8_21_14_2_50_41_107]PIW94579.1 MAG: hypothetical protein COZ86_00350 [Candidatus Moranbacteria bacterium CG_4_8_14_3_um_filter_41_13]PIX91632.1 MAG: hypothetical protein COZ27_01805 [Candidatus Moranbacteria bacterium CG_4_10_14_3_um_filter_41_65]PJC00256.1 MAG: hypothetical
MDICGDIYGEKMKKRGRSIYGRAFFGLSLLIISPCMSAGAGIADRAVVIPILRDRFFLRESSITLAHRARSYLFWLEYFPEKEEKTTATDYNYHKKNTQFNLQKKV